jgi:alkylation response protein AidB-like acyl-CoA dehydrogenase
MNAPLDVRTRRDLARTSSPAERARRVVPIIAAHADQIERERALPVQVLDALHEYGLFRLLLPASLSGEEVEPAHYVQVMMILAAADASTTWCIAQGSGCSMAAAYMDPAAAQVIWRDDPRAVLAWGAGPQGVARLVDGGYVVNGAWAFASGNRHASWIGGHCRLQQRDADGNEVERTMLFPRARAVIGGDWNVIGLRGTGSDSYAVKDLFVPEAFSLCRDLPTERRELGPLYKFSTSHLYGAGFGAVALGIARGALDALIDLAGKIPHGSSRLLCDSPVVQTHMALAQAKWHAARLLLTDTLQQAWTSVAEGAEMSLDMRMRIRMSATFATHTAKEVVDVAYHEAGATAIFEANPFERRFRDVHSVSQQVQARYSHFETVGAHLLGVTPANLHHI